MANKISMLSSFSLLLILLLDIGLRGLSLNLASAAFRYPMALHALRKSPMEPVVLTPSYRLASGILALAAASYVAGLNSIGAGPLALGAFAGFIALQTTRVRFLFDPDAFEVMISKNRNTNTSQEELSRSGENFAVGGRNRWTYKSVTEWCFVPSKRLPILLYFNENQTPGSTRKGRKGQFHLFPVIMDAKQLDKVMTERVGPSMR